MSVADPGFSQGGGPFRVKCQVDAIQWGGSSRNCPCSPKADATQWGGGECQEFSVNGALLPFTFFSFLKGGAGPPGPP